MNLNRSLLCPCANVRRTCAELLQDDDDWTTGGPRGVRINDDALTNLANQIIMQQQQNQKKDPVKDAIETNDTATSTKKNNNKGNESLLTSWDEHEWHYTGRNYRGGNEQNRRERVALSILAIDAINFCFWPLSEYTTDSTIEEANDDGSPHSQRLNQNRIEYEHLAKTLKYMAQRDDNDETSHPRSPTGHDEHDATTPTVSSPAFAFSPIKLATMTVAEMTHELQEAWKNIKSERDISPSLAKTLPDTFVLQNMKERCRLWNELGTVLLTQFQGSATLFLQQGLTPRGGGGCDCNGSSSHDQGVTITSGAAAISACSLVQWLIQHFSGYRDEAVEDYRGRWICFYKRAQICVADLHGALDLTTLMTPSNQHSNANHNNSADNVNSNANNESSNKDNNNNNMKVLDALTTFADYRVPQYLRHAQVLEYSPSLAACIDQGQELSGHRDASESTGRMQELYIRAATVVVAQRLVQECCQKMKDDATIEISHEERTTKYHLNDVLVDWYLWQLGEGMLSEMKPHHRVRTIYY